jgi:hypothetical protein
VPQFSTQTFQKEEQGRPSLIIGEATKKEKVTPSGTPASTKPKNNGIALQEQKGVIIPNVAARKLPKYLLFLDKMLRIFSGGKNDLIIETIKIITESKMKIFIVS